jgi:hypothetical protein
MNLDDMKQRWEEQDQKLDAILRLNIRLLQRPVLNKAKTAMWRLFLLLTVDVLLNFATAVCLGSFIANHVMEARFLIPAVLLHLSVIGLLIAGGRQLTAIASLDYNAPVVTIQKQLESLRAWRIRATQLTLLVSPLLWIPLLIVTMKGLLGLDAYAIFFGRWLAINVLFGLAVIPLAVWLARRYAGRMDRSPLVQRLLRDLGGYNLNAATGFLSSLEQFEAEP